MFATVRPAGMILAIMVVIALAFASVRALAGDRQIGIVSPTFPKPAPNINPARPSLTEASGPRIIWGVIERNSGLGCSARYHEEGWNVRKSASEDCVIQFTAKGLSLKGAAFFVTASRMKNANQGAIAAGGVGLAADVVIDESNNTIEIRNAPAGIRIAFQVLTP